MTKLMKRSFAMAMGGALLALSTSAAAGETKSSAVKLSDADLDQITAGSGAFSAVAISNPGKRIASELHGRPEQFPSHSTCINCMGSEPVSKATGLVGIALPNERGIVIIELGTGRIF